MVMTESEFEVAFEGVPDGLVVPAWGEGGVVEEEWGAVGGRRLLLFPGGDDNTYRYKYVLIYIFGTLQLYAATAGEFIRPR